MNFDTAVDDSAIPKFTDIKGGEWFPRLDYARLAKIRDQVGIDLGKPERIGKAWGTLLSDDLKALDTIWLAISPEISKDEWLSAMDGPALECAMDSLALAVQLFTQPQHRKMLTEGLNAVNKAYKLAIKEAEVGIQSELESAIQTALMRGKQEVAVPV